MVVGYSLSSLPGVVGDFTTVPNAPSNSIQVLSMSTGAECAGTTCEVENLTFLKSPDGASPKLFLALITGTPYATAAFNFWEAPTSGVNYTKTYTVYLTQAKLTSSQISAAEAAAPAESVSLSFTTIAFQDNLSGGVSCYNVSTKATSGSLTC